MNNDELILEAKEFFNAHKTEIGKYVKKGLKVIPLSFEELSAFSIELSEKLLEKPEEILALFSEALEDLYSSLKDARIRLLELPESQKLKIREIRAKHLGKILEIEGIIRQASEVRPRVINAKFECPTCGTVITVLQIDTSYREPSRCTSCGRKAGFKELKKDMVDAQRLVAEETPESLTGGEQPRRINILLKEDLVEPKMEEKTTPGSKVRVIGVLREVPIYNRGGTVGTTFDIAIDANNIIPLEESFEEIEISEEEERQIKEIAADDNLFSKLASSIAPSVYGHTEVKLAIAMQLLGGVKKTRSDGTATRGDMHILLVGDPGVAKSVMLKFISSNAPKGRYVVGKSASKAGLTAAVVKDEILKSWSLEAGVMVLANKGIACIDEMEKMDEEDRSSMHEAMEQQTVTITKATIQATLRAETAVLGAANPKLGRFNIDEPISHQINMSPSLLNRFDLIFVLKDVPQKERDEMIASHVLMEHGGEKHLVDIIDSHLLRKYFAYAKQNIHPILTPQASQEIKDFYVNIRNPRGGASEDIKAIAISARQLEALIRLSEASAKARLSKKVTKEDARRAIKILHYCMLQVGFDAERGVFDIDRITTGITASERSKILTVKEILTKLESQKGKLIPIEDLIQELGNKITKEQLDEVLDKLKRDGDIFEPRRGFIQRV
ncbi:minichromosome maintenance protein MCM [Candidatus Pacearchaeota archaeon]|nr:minichromosome maintenance protein MCM [Candidatus Pacearchaeota archaeon]